MPALRRGSATYDSARPYKIHLVDTSDRYDKRIYFSRRETKLKAIDVESIAEPFLPIEKG